MMPQGVPSITARDAAAAIDPAGAPDPATRPLIVDVREADEFAAERIQGVALVPISQFRFARLVQQLRLDCRYRGAGSRHPLDRSRRIRHQKRDEHGGPACHRRRRAVPRRRRGGHATRGHRLGTIRAAREQDGMADDPDGIDEGILRAGPPGRSRIWFTIGVYDLTTPYPRGDPLTIPFDPVIRTNTLKVRFLDSSGQTVSDLTTTVTFSASQNAYVGELILPAGFPAGTYLLYVRLSNTWRRYGDLVAISAGSESRTSETTLELGNVDGASGDVMLSYFEFTKCYELTSPTTQCPAAHLAASDFNADGVVDQDDENLFDRAAQIRLGD